MSKIKEQLLIEGSDPSPCPECHGHGTFTVETDLYSGASYQECCSVCDGTGYEITLNSEKD